MKSLSKKNLMGVALMIMLPIANLFAQQSTASITVQQNTGNGNVRVGGNYSNADHITIDVLNKTDNTKISNQGVVIQGGGKWYYDKPIVAGKMYKFAVKAWNNKTGEGKAVWNFQDNVTAFAPPKAGPTPPVTAAHAPIIQRRYIVNDMVNEYAKFADGIARPNSASLSASLSLPLSFSLGIQGNFVWGVYLKKNSNPVNYFSKSDNGNTVTLEGKTYDTEKSNGTIVLIGYGATYYYIPRKYLGTEPGI